MKTLQDLENLIPTLLPIFKKQVIDNFSHLSSDQDKSTESLYYDKDGWYIEIFYEVDCEWGYESATRDCPSSTWLEDFSAVITEGTISHYDRDTDEEVNFTEGAVVDVLYETIEKLINE
ncbi:MAG: hypothetical protein ACI4AM_02300 [Muribaculaceae bacterium]